MSTLDAVFYILAALILVSGSLVAFRPMPIESALWLVLNFILSAALYVLLGSQFVAVIQILVYAGAIVVLFTFVILLLNLNPKEIGLTAAIPWTSLVLFVAALSVVLLCMHVATPELLAKMPPLEEGSAFGTVENFSRIFLERYIWSFEIGGVMLLLAIIGVGLVSHRPSSAWKEGPDS